MVSSRQPRGVVLALKVLKLWLILLRSPIEAMEFALSVSRCWSIVYRFLPRALIFSICSKYIRIIVYCVHVFIIDTNCVIGYKFLCYLTTYKVRQGYSRG